MSGSGSGPASANVDIGGSTSGLSTDAAQKALAEGRGRSFRDRPGHPGNDQPRSSSVQAPLLRWLGNSASTGRSLRPPGRLLRAGSTAWSWPMGSSSRAWTRSWSSGPRPSIGSPTTTIRGTGILFGNGAGAAVVERDPTRVPASVAEPGTWARTATTSTSSMPTMAMCCRWMARRSSAKPSP